MWRIAIASLCVLTAAVGVSACGSETSATADTTAQEAPASECVKVKGEALTTITGDVKGTPDTAAVFAVKSDTAPEFGSFKRSGLYFVAVQTTGKDADGNTTTDTPVLAVSGDFLTTGGGLAFPADNVSGLYFRTIGADIDPGSVAGYSINDAADRAKECVAQATGR